MPPPYMVLPAGRPLRREASLVFAFGDVLPDGGIGFEIGERRCW